MNTINPRRKEVLIRADSSNLIGTGHIQRCLRLARILRGLHDCKVSLLSRPSNGDCIDLIRDADFELIKLNSYSHVRNSEFSTPHSHWSPTSWQNDSDECLNAIKNMRIPIDWIVTDHYAYDYRWEEKLSSNAKGIFCIDDLADRKHSCQFLLDQNYHSSTDNRYENLVTDNCRLMLGPHFALLDEEFEKARWGGFSNLDSEVIVSCYFGGRDVFNLTERTIHAFNKCNIPSSRLAVVISSQSPNFDRIIELCETQKNIDIHVDLPNLADVLAKSTFSIGAGGTTTLERLCIGLPSIVVTVAANQVPSVSKLAQDNLVHWIGSAENTTQEEITNAIIHINNELKKCSSQPLPNLVDGRGAKRVADFLMLDNSTTIHARPVRWSDFFQLLKWANDPVVRQNAFSPSRITNDEHLIWLQKRLADHVNSKFYIMQTATETEIGQVRFQRESNFWEIHYSMDSLARGRGIGTKFLRTALIRFLNEVENSGLIKAKVFKTNRRSIKLLESLNFKIRQDETSELSLTYGLKP